METLLIGIKNEKAKQILTDLATLDLIEIKEQPVIKPTIKLSELKNRITNKMKEADIDKRMQILRK